MFKNIKFASPDITEKEKKKVLQVLESGWLTSGKVVEQFEKNFESFIGHPFLATAVNSATSGLHLALEAVGVKAGDEVITTTHTFTATAEVIRYLDATPIFVDVNPRTLCIDTEQVVNKISNKTKAIIPVHFAGKSAKMDDLIELRNKHGIKIIEDAAHALPTKWCDNIIGSLDTDATVFSFYANKTMTTGEGGMVLTKYPYIYDRMRIMRLHGIDRDVFQRFNNNKISSYYEVVAPGFKYNMMDLSAAVGIEQLKRLKQFHKKRINLAKKYYQALKDYPIILPLQPENFSNDSWHLFVIQIDSNCKINRDKIISILQENGIGTSIHYIPLHLHPYWKNKYHLKKEHFPVSQNVYENCLSLPLHTKMEEGDISYIKNVFDTIYR
jgi:dTDP-4-amino-4,6-dideoxygalactose transaminase